MRIIALSFFAIIITGALLLMLPISTTSHQGTDFLTALFTATSATCVTGLVVVETATYWTGFGQTVILLLIQIGGLGFMTIIGMFFLLSNHQVGLRERIIMMQSLNLSKLDGVVRLVKHVLLGTLIFEGAGALILMTRFIPDVGIGKGIWYGVFHSVSAFCNAGFDIIGTVNGAVGAMVYADDPVVLITLASLLIIGGIGFFVWEDVYRNKRFKRLQIHSKIALIVTAVLLVGGTLGFLLIEYKNTKTIGSFGFGQKLLNSFFQSATPRTAGYNSIDQGLMTDAGKMLTIILMFIGAGGGSTAGGVKTVTVGVLVLSLIAVMRNKRDVVVFGRRIETSQVVNAAALLSFALILTITGGMIISLLDNLPFLHTYFEIVSAYATVGLSTGITSQLCAASKLILIIAMFLGRVGVTTVSIALIYKNDRPASIIFPVEGVMIG
jgi:Trk-type K+ transport systems, membrane components